MERRKKTDIWAKTLFYLNILAWGLLLVLFLVFHRAQPEYETLFDRFYKLKLRTQWDIQYLSYLIWAVSFSIMVCLSGLLLSIFRGRRKNDQKKALIITAITSLCMLIIAFFVL